VLLNMPKVVISHSLLVLQYPIMPIAHSFHRLCNPSRSFQRPLGPRMIISTRKWGIDGFSGDIHNAIDVLAVGLATGSRRSLQLESIQG
jgi:hypothetical protein